MSGRVVFLNTHPIQYHAPLYRELTQQGLDLEVFYCMQPEGRMQAEIGFGVAFQWNVDLLSGYRHRFLKNAAKHPTLRGFWGMDTPEIGAILRNERPAAVVIYGWHFLAALQTVLACVRLGIPY